MQPIQALTKDDKELIRQWCINYASAEPQSVEKVLTHWNKNKKKLFRGFGNQLRISFPIHQKVNSTYRASKWRGLYSPLIVYDIYDIRYFKEDPRNHVFINSLGAWLRENWQHIDFVYMRDLCEYTKYYYVEEGKTSSDKEFRREDGKILKIPCGTKIMRALRKVLQYYGYSDMEKFNKWRDDVSVINTDREIDAELVLSIHPIDYMTMSDNKCGWTSCMSWVDKGCYSVGTIEMMNSNMAIVAYLENPCKFEYNGYKIPNKSWRTLVFANKDIMIVGKHYPYQSETLAKIILEKLQEVLKPTLRWKYQYKNQPYSDMIHSNSNRYIRNHFSRYKWEDSHKIYTYMNTMYADMIEDHSTVYWCCRNYVPHNKYYNLSGHATCMCCGEPIATSTRWGGYDEDTLEGAVKFCDNCAEEYGCVHCKTIAVTDGKTYYQIPIGVYHRPERVCEFCLLTEYVYSVIDKTFVPEHRAHEYLEDECGKRVWAVDPKKYLRMNRERVEEFELRGTICKL